MIALSLKYTMNLVHLYTHWMYRSIRKELNWEQSLENDDCALSVISRYVQDSMRHLEEKVDVILTANITQALKAMLDTVVFS